VVEQGEEAPKERDKDDGGNKTGPETPEHINTKARHTVPVGINDGEHSQGGQGNDEHRSLEHQKS
jgi:hypothetical protein